MSSGDGRLLINDDAQAAARPGVFVQATRDFTYDENVGDVRLGQVFKLAGHPNDAGLIRHQFVAVLPEQPKDDDYARHGFFQCGECGRFLVEEWHRTRCGDMDTMSEAERNLARRERIGKRQDHPHQGAQYIQQVVQMPA